MAQAEIYDFELLQARNYTVKTGITQRYTNMMSIDGKTIVEKGQLRLAVSPE